MQRGLKVNLALRVFCLIMIISLAAGCGFPGSPASTPTPEAATPLPLEPTQAPVKMVQMNLPPVVVEADPAPTSEIPLDSAINISFNQSMDQASVEAAVKMDPSIGGRFTWADDRTFSFQPDQPFLTGSDVQFSIAETAKAQNGLSLTEPVEIAYRAVGTLQVTQRIPENRAADVDPSSAVAVSFNRPVTTLGVDPSQGPAAFTLEPEVEGQGKWVNTSTYVFYPAISLAGGIEYTVHVDTSLNGADGSAFEEASRETEGAEDWTFQTAAPQLLTVEPSTETPLPLDASLVLTFNQPMDQASTASAFSFATLDGAAVEGEITWNDKSTVLTFKPTRRLDRDTLFNLTLSGSALAQGGTALGADFAAEVISMDRLSLSGSEPWDGDTLVTYAGYGTVILHFNCPLEEIKNASRLTFSPEIADPTISIDSASRTVYIYGSFEPETDYSLTIAPEFEDAYGGTLGNTITLNFHTAATPSALYLSSDQTGAGVMYLTTQDTAIKAQAVNLNTLNIKQGAVSWADYLDLFGENGYDLRQNYALETTASWSQSISAERNKTVDLDIPVSAEGNALAPGLYGMEFNSPEISPSAYSSRSLIFLVVSDIQVTLKLGTTNALVWAVNMTDGKPAAGESVTIYDSGGNSLAEGVTDEQGLFQTELAAREDPYLTIYAVTGQPGEAGFGMTNSNWNAGVSGWSFGLTSYQETPHLEMYLYTDRPIYRPGQTVYFKGIARQADNARYVLPDMFHQTIDLYSTDPTDYSQDLMATYDLSLSDFGTVNGSYTLPDDASPGTYYFSLPDQPSAGLSFTVADYRTPQVELNVSLSADDVLMGDSLDGEINAQYYFGAPAGGFPIYWTLYRHGDWLNLADMQVGTSSTDWFYPDMITGDLGSVVASGEAKTENDGTVSLSLPTTWEGDISGSPQKFTLEVTLQNDNGQTVSGRASTRVHPSEFYIGAKADQWFGQADEPMGFTIETVDWNGQPVQQENLTAEFQSVTWERTLNSFGYSTYTMHTEPVSSSNFSTDATGKARLQFSAPDPGTYQLELRGQGAITQMFIWVSGPGLAQWPDLRNQQVHLVADKDSYEAGDQAQVLIPNPFGRLVKALVTVERGRVMSSQIVELEENGSQITLDITEDDAPNVYVSATLLNTGTAGQFAFRQGYVELTVDPREELLNVEVSGLPESAGPGDEVDLTLRVTDSAGNPVQGEFSVAVVDKAILALADANSADIDEFFYGRQPLGVQISLSMAIYAGRKMDTAGGMGGGGDGALTPSLSTRENFKDTAYWIPDLVTDDQGMGTVTVKLPDNLTTWVFDVRGITVDSRVGKATAELVSNKALMIQPDVPGFLVMGDHLEIAATIHNQTGADQEVTTELHAQGITLDDDSQAIQQASVPAGGKARVSWWGTVTGGQASGGAELLFTAEAGGYSDQTTPSDGTIPILLYTNTQSYASSGVVDAPGERVEVISLPNGGEVLGGSLQVNLQPSLAAVIFDGLETLDIRMNEDTESVISKTLPNLEAYAAIENLDLNKPDLKAELLDEVTQGVNRLIALQNEDGGWGWSAHGESTSYLTAYVLFGLTQAQQVGMESVGASVDQAVTFLQNNVTFRTSQDTSAWELNQHAFILFAQQQAGAGDIDKASALYEVRDRLDSSSRALLALTIEGLSEGDERARTLISDLEGEAYRSGSSARWLEGDSPAMTWSSTRQTTAVVVYALAKRDPAADILPGAIRYLVESRSSHRGWISTYENAWVYLALTQALQGTGELQAQYGFSAALNTAPVATGEAGGETSLNGVSVEIPVDQLFADAPNGLVIEHGEGSGSLYYDAVLQAAVPVEDATAFQNGIQVERQYVLQSADCTGADCGEVVHQAAISQDQVTTPLTVKVTLTLAQDADFLKVEDWIPAGAEIVNQQLNTAVQGVETQTLYKVDDPFQDGWGWWYFNSPVIYSDHLVWTGEDVPAGSYTLTYTIIPTQAGEFQVLPARAWESFYPDIQGSSAGEIFTITQK